MLTPGELASLTGQLIKACERVAVFCIFELNRKNANFNKQNKHTVKNLTHVDPWRACESNRATHPSLWRSYGFLPSNFQSELMPSTLITNLNKTHSLYWQKEVAS